MSLETKGIILIGAQTEMNKKNRLYSRVYGMGGRVEVHFIQNSAGGV